MEIHSGKDSLPDIWINTENWVDFPNYKLEISEILFYELLILAIVKW